MEKRIGLKAGTDAEVKKIKDARDEVWKKRIRKTKFRGRKSHVICSKLFREYRDDNWYWCYSSGCYITKKPINGLYIGSLMKKERIEKAKRF